MKPADVKWSTYIASNKKNKEKDLKFKAGNHVRISKYKNIANDIKELQKINQR